MGAGAPAPWWDHQARHPEEDELMTDTDDIPDLALDYLAARSPKDYGASIFDPVFEVLAAPTTRYIIYILLECETATFDAVVTQVAAWAREHDRLDEHDRLQRVAMEISHVSLPNLVDAGLMDVDGETGTLALTVPADSVRRLLHECHRCELDDG